MSTGNNITFRDGKSKLLFNTKNFCIPNQDVRPSRKRKGSWNNNRPSKIDRVEEDMDIEDTGTSFCFSVRATLFMYLTHCIFENSIFIYMKIILIREYMCVKVTKYAC